MKTLNFLSIVIKFFNFGIFLVKLNDFYNGFHKKLQTLSEIFFIFWYKNIKIIF